MSTFNQLSFQDPRNINLKGSASRGSGVIRFSQQGVTNWTTNPFSTTDAGLYVNGSGQLVFSYLGTAVLISGGSVGTPTIAVTTANGITAAAITAGGSDTVGQITTTGTNNNVGATVLTVTFNKAFATAPRSVQLGALNASGALITPYISAITTTTFTITIPASASSGATPSWCYDVTA